MFKKRAPRKKSVDEDDITVSVPQDLTDLESSPPTNTSSFSSKIPDETSTRKNAENHHTLPHQPWKPWDTQKKTMHGRRTSQNSKISSISSTISATIPSSGTTTTTTTTTTLTTTATATTSVSDSKSPGMMLNLANMFSSAPSTPQQTQHVEAQLWNADISLTSPISPATPRYIPAISGNAANTRVHGTGNNGRLTSGWTTASASTSRKSNDGSAGWKSFGQATSMQSSSLGLGVAGSGTRTRSPSISSHSNSAITSPQISSPPDHNGNFERPSNKTSMSFGSVMSTSGYGNIPNTVLTNDGRQNGQLAAGAEGNLPISSASNESLNARPYDGAPRKNTFSRGFKEDSNYPKDGGKSSETFHQMRYSRQNHGYDDDELEDRKKDRNYGHSRYSSRIPSIFRDPKRILRTRLFYFRQNRRIHPAIRLIIIFLLGGSVLYTTFHLMFRESNTKDKIRKSFDYTEQQLRVQKILGQAGTLRKKPITIFDVEAQQYSIQQWKLDTYDVNNSKAAARISEDYMLSKAYNGAMQPTRVIPFYFRASFKDENDDDDLHEDDNDGLRNSESDSQYEHISQVQVDPSMVTITTLITPDRYGVFLRLVKQYRGPISVATHIRQGPDQDKMFHDLQEFFQQHPILRRYVDLHVIVDGVDFQLNMWRNVARMFARTDYFMMLDVDFHIPSSLKNNLHHDPRIQELLTSGCALVVPAFEYDVMHDPKDSKYFPDTKAELTKLLENKHIRVFHDSFPPGHAATDTPRWIKMSKGLDSGRVFRPIGGRAGFDDSNKLVPENKDPDGIAIEGIEPITPEEQEEYLEQEADGERPYKVTAFEPKYEPYIILKREGTPWCDERFVGYGGNKARMIVTGEWYTSKADNLRQQCSSFEDFLQSADEWAEEFEEKHPGSLLQDPVFVADISPELKKQRSRLGLGIPSSGGDGTHVQDDRYMGDKFDKVLGDQVVNDEEFQDPFMNRPKGKVWGGIQPRKYYIPPPPTPGSDIPIDGIDVEAAISGDQDSSLNNDQVKNDHVDDLTGEKLEQFRQGIIMPDGVDSGSQYESHGQHNHENSNNETESTVHDDSSIHHKGSEGEGDGSDSHHVEDSERRNQSESGSSNPGIFDDARLSFQDAAERLEEKYRQLGALDK
ncbi:hypothetical protein BGZ76_011245 [Entomortierella beljakovae]|nr:hypothetical protein BGZ76_011245 [Entomortierella beljakovae]